MSSTWRTGGGVGGPGPITRGTLGFSLGAVGGARGTAAGFGRILMELVLNYNGERVKQIQADVQNINKALVSGTQERIRLQEQIVKKQRDIAQADRIIAAATKDQKAAVAEINRLHAERARTLGKNVAYNKAEIAALAAALGISQRQARFLAQREANQARLVALQQRETNVNRAINGLLSDRLKLESALVNIRELGARAAAAARNLLIGAVSALIGGQILTALLYAPIQAAMDSISRNFELLIDPAKGAEEAVVELGDAIRATASEQNIDRLTAARIELEKMAGLSFTTPEQGSAAAAVSQNKELLELFSDQLDVRVGVNKTLTDTNREVARQYLLQQQLGSLGNEAWQLELRRGLELQKSGDLLFKIGDFIGGQVLGQGTFNDKLDAALGLNSQNADLYAEQARSIQDANLLLDQQRQALADITAELTKQAITDYFDSQIDATSRALEATTQRIQDNVEALTDRIRDRAEAATEKIRDSTDARIKAIQKQMEAIDNRGPSERTERLMRLIERLNDQEERRKFREQLSEIAEQRHLILLRMRLALSEKEINLDKYKGKERIIAIDALLERMRKQNEAQDRFNQLLDIQYQINQGVRRQQGETIREFVERRAQYYRDLLQQAAELRRQGPQADLEAEKERVQAGIDLQELADRRRELIEQRARDRYMKDLQDRLKASQDADRRAAEAEKRVLQERIERIRNNSEQRIKAINEQRDADIEAAKNAGDKAIETARRVTQATIDALQRRKEAALFWTDSTNVQQRILALGQAKTLEQINAIAGQVAGSSFSLAYLQAQLTAMGVPWWQQTSILQGAASLKTAYDNALGRLAGQAKNDYSNIGGSAYAGFNTNAPGGYAKGGFIELSNSMNFGQNMRFGEEGIEGLVLPNKIMEAIRARTGEGAFDGATFNVQGTGDPWRDTYALKQMIKEVVREELH